MVSLNKSWYFFLHEEWVWVFLVCKIFVFVFFFPTRWLSDLNSFHLKASLICKTSLPHTQVTKGRTWSLEKAQSSFLKSLSPSNTSFLPLSESQPNGFPNCKRSLEVYSTCDPWNTRRHRFWWAGVIFALRGVMSLL